MPLTAISDSAFGLTEQYDTALTSWPERAPLYVKLAVPGPIVVVAGCVVVVVGAVVVGGEVVVVGAVEVGTPGRVVVEGEVLEVVDEVVAFGEPSREDTAA